MKRSSLPLIWHEHEKQRIKISYDPEIDALYIRLLEGRQECRFVRLSDEVALNIGTGEKLVGIEILDAHRFYALGKRRP